MSSFTWYSRLAVWLGALVLIVQSVLGRPVGPITLVATLALGLGLLAFVAGLGLIEPARTALGVLEAAADSPEAVTPPLPSEPRRPSIRRRAKPGRVIAFDVTEGQEVAGTACARCSLPIAAGSMAARCPVCGTAHHAACWTEGHFRCAVEGCSGSGSLEAPSA